MKQARRIRVIGIHQHIGSGIRDAAQYVAAMGVLLQIALNVKDLLPDLQYVNIGGGIGTRYRPSDRAVDLDAFGSHVHEAFSAFQSEFVSGTDRTPPRLVLEPGRFIVADAGFLICRVNTLKSVAGRVFAGVDTGTRNLLTRILNPPRRSHHYSIAIVQVSTTFCGLACTVVITTYRTFRTLRVLCSPTLLRAISVKAVMCLHLQTVKLKVETSLLL